MQQMTTKTLFDYWNGLRGARSAPDRRDIDPARIKSALGSTFILELDDRHEYSFRLAGSHLCSAYTRELKGRSFSRLWHAGDRDAMDTLLKAVTEDHAVALVNFQGTTESNAKLSFETMLLPIRHNGATDVRLLGSMTALDAPYWFGTDPIAEQRITGLRLIWPDENAAIDMARDIAASLTADVTFADRDEVMPQPMAATVFGRSARRYAHLAVIDGGRPH
jgi:hypothetical protein